MINPAELGQVFRVGSLAEAMTHWAEAAADDKPLPTFIADVTKWRTWRDDIRSTYTIEIDINGIPRRWMGVMIYVVGDTPPV